MPAIGRVCSRCEAVAEAAAEAAAEASEEGEGVESP
jgi:hypothetical protein